jgi:hypothetical protein
MDQPSFRVPFVLPVELDGIALTKRGDPRGEIDVVGDQNCLAPTQTDDETLVATAIVVIRENFLLPGGCSSLDPHLPIPNRTVKRVCADDSVQLRTRK